MDEQLTSLLVALIAAGVPACTTLVTYFFTRKTARRDKGGLYILMLIMQDQINWEFYNRVPTNFDAITDEYADYHANGGNGKVTKAVNDYKSWFTSVEKELIEIENFKKENENG